MMLMIACLTLNGSAHNKLQAYYHKTSGAMIAAELINLACEDQIASYHTQGLKIIACLEGTDCDKEIYQPRAIVHPHDFDRECKALHPQDVINFYQAYNAISQATTQRKKNNFYECLQDHSDRQDDSDSNDTSSVNIPWTGDTFWHAAIHRKTGKVTDQSRALHSNKYMHVKFTKENHIELKKSNYQLTPEELVVALKLEKAISKG